MAYTTINKSTDHFFTKLWSGTNSGETISGIPFQPDFNWTKQRTGTQDHVVVDAVRGVQKTFFTNAEDAEYTLSDGITAWTSDGFTHGTNNRYCEASNTFASWSWKANGAGSSNSDGSITSTVSANTTSGFSIVKFTGTGANATIGHGLGVAPKMILVKTTGTGSWIVYHKGMGATHEIYMNSTAVQNDVDTAFNDSAPTDTVFSIGTSNGMNSSGEDYIAYVYCNVAGYQKAGTFEGNGNAFPNSPFIYLGFKPKLFLWKNIDAGNSDDNWNMINAEAQEYNAQDKGYLMANSNGAETGYSGNSINFLSNGVKLNVSSAYHNSSGETYIYYAVGQTIVGTNNIPATAR